MNRVDSFKELFEAIDKEIKKQALSDVADSIEKEANVTVPVDTGELKASIHKEKISNEDVKVIADVVDPVDGARYSEITEVRSGWMISAIRRAKNRRIKK